MEATASSIFCLAVVLQENSHFKISDVLISVFEQMTWDASLRKKDGTSDHSDDDSDVEINSLKQRIRIRRRERQLEVEHSLD